MKDVDYRGPDRRDGLPLPGNVCPRPAEQSTQDRVLARWANISAIVTAVVTIVLLITATGEIPKDEQAGTTTTAHSDK